jgi:hypothetical protein
MSCQPVNNNDLMISLYTIIKEETEDTNKAREAELKRLRKGKRGRPYQPIKHNTRENLNKKRDKLLEKYQKKLSTADDEPPKLNFIRNMTKADLESVSYTTTGNFDFFNNLTPQEAYELLERQKTMEFNCS